jgi:hypothetical protein
VQVVQVMVLAVVAVALVIKIIIQSHLEQV